MYKLWKLHSFNYAWDACNLMSNQWGRNEGGGGGGELAQYYIFQSGGGGKGRSQAIWRVGSLRTKGGYQFSFI